MEYEFTKHGNFSSSDFLQKIQQAKESIWEQNKMQEIQFEESRNSVNLGYTIGKKQMEGNLIRYKILSRNKLLGYLSCFLSNNKDYMEVISRPE